MSNDEIKRKKNQHYKKIQKKTLSQLQLTRLTNYPRYKIKITQQKKKWNKQLSQGSNSQMLNGEFEK